MRPICLILLLALAGIHRTEAQAVPQPPPQTARQALLEMLTGKTPGAFEKHLTEATRKALLRGDSSNSPILQGFSAFSVGLAANSKHLLTFESGSLLLSMEENNGRQKLEIAVERDDLLGDADEIELSLRSYKEGVLEPLPVVPRLTFSMKQEKEIWKLNEITLALRVPLGDAEFLKGLQKSQNGALESSAVGSLRTLNTAEVSYAASFPERGYTCKLSELGGFSTGSGPKPEHAMLIDDTLASGKKSGYVFAISGCDVRPASKYQTTAVPADPESGMRAFCSDESAVLRYAADGKAATCLSEGMPLQ
jgi:type IV pilus assembly protein PilA